MFRVNTTSTMSFSQSPTQHPIIQAFKNFFYKLVQNPEVYPIKYYKKSNRLKKRLPTVK